MTKTWIKICTLFSQEYCVNVKLLFLKINVLWSCKTLTLEKARQNGIYGINELLKILFLKVISKYKKNLSVTGVHLAIKKKKSIPSIYC
jgi:hypothetical protein